ncbi:MAG: XRE family transcriptional regulator [Candidatus Moraniibacteriota bacterium]|nr:MAG: XRE family transcriptional regulator [Candidatus Moranbacteria bacterium]
MNIQNLACFLNEANKETYANKNASKATPTRLASEDYHFEKGNIIYHDTYFGGRDFIGEEIVYESNKPVWGANYFGFILNKNIDEKEVYTFLREALMQKCNDVIPVRGPSSFSKDNNRYTFTVEGNLSSFSGTEEISFNGTIVYRCLLHGGLIV